MESQASFCLQLEETQAVVAADIEVIPSSQGSGSQDKHAPFSVGTTLGLLSSSKNFESTVDLFQESMGLEGPEERHVPSDVLTSQESQPDPYGECSERPFLGSTPSQSAEVKESQASLKWSDKFKAANIGKLNFNSSTSSDLDNVVQTKSLDDSVIEVIEDSPEKKHISIIDLGDSLSDSKEFKLVLDDTQSPQTKKTVSDTQRMNISEMSEILANNSLLYENCENVDQMISNDEDVQSMLAHPASDLMDLDDSKEDGDMSDFLQKSPSGVSELNLFSPKKSKKEAWSPKKEIWSSSKNEKKRKASLSSGDESSNKKIALKDSSSNLTKVNEKSSEANHGDDESTQSQHKQDTDSGPESRPTSSQAIQSPDISCSPIVSVENQGREGSHDPTTRRTSTPGHKGKLSAPGLSSPQKHLRKKMQQQQEISPHQNSSEDEANITRPARKKPSKSTLPDEDTQVFKEPTPFSSPEGQVLKFSLMVDSKTYNNPQFQEEFQKFKTNWNIQIDLPDVPKKRLSDVSTFSRSSTGGSSGYLGGSSSGVTSSSGGSGRSRLSIDPDLRIERHKNIAKLPKRNPCYSEPSSVEAVAGSQESEAHHVATVEFANDERVDKIQSQREITEIPEETEEEPKISTPKVGRKRKESVDKEKEPTPRKRLIKKRSTRKDSEESVDEKEEIPEENIQPQISSIDDRYGIGNRVFARWRDGTGVYFYAAIIKSEVNEEEVKVMFMEDKIERIVIKYQDYLL